jgi:hypothetical protein
MFGVAKADAVEDEVLINVSKEHMALLNKALEDTTITIDKGILKQMGDSFKGFATAEKMINPCVEEVDNNWAHVRSAEMLVHYPRTAKQGEEYEDHTVNPGWLNFHNVKDLLARFFVTIHANYGKVRNWRDLCIGITSIDHEGGQMPMFDYDGKNIKTRVKKDIKKIQKEFGLGDAAIYETRRGLHVYFFSDLVDLETYKAILDSVECCKGFKTSFEKNGYAVLRVSAKYTEFDILPYKVIVSPNRGRTRPGRKAALVQELLRLGQECGTHFASMYPQWAHYGEDKTPWKTAGKKRPGRRVRKISKAEYVKKQAYMKQKEQTYKIQYNTNHWTSNTTTTSTANFVVNTGTMTYK